MSIRENLKEVMQRIAQVCERRGRSPEEITLVAVTKGVTVSAIREAFSLGVRFFGENRVQEARGKVAELVDLTPDITWHMLGHLQSNKAKLAPQLFSLVHSVDSVKLAQILSHYAEGGLPVLLQVNTSGEATRSGFTPQEVFTAAQEIGKLPHLEVKGLMTIAPLAGAEEVRQSFRKLRQLKNTLGLEHLSMGMTDDFEIAIEEGATILRIGRAIFGERDPHPPLSLER